MITSLIDLELSKDLMLSKKPINFLKYPSQAFKANLEKKYANIVLELLNH